MRAGASQTALRALAHTPLLVVASDDGLSPAADALVATMNAEGNTQMTIDHAATDHGWSDHRIALETAVLDWLARLPCKTPAWMDRLTSADVWQWWNADIGRGRA